MSLIEPWIAVSILVFQIIIFLRIGKKKMELDATISKAGQGFFKMLANWIEAGNTKAENVNYKQQKEKEKLRKIQKELHHKKSFNDEESTKLSSDLADITSRL